jgi:SAM-dependent methyltransferase
MHWKLKAAIQNSVASLPDSLSYATYYWIQRRFGGLKNVNPVGRLQSGLETWQRIVEAGGEPSGKAFFEVGTGRMALAPLAYWLMGAEKTITVDLNPYLKFELIQESLQYMWRNLEEIRGLFGSSLQESRLESLRQLTQGTSFSQDQFLEHCRIQYIAPGDAAKTPLSPGSIDFHTSYQVFEHIPREILAQILAEGNRIIRDQGLFVHHIDYSDHFSHSDSSISAINFLQYSDSQWEKYAGNRYMYMNRLRHDDYLDLFLSAGHRIRADLPDVDPALQTLLKSGKAQLDQRFADKSVDVLSMTGSWIVSGKEG